MKILTQPPGLAVTLLALALVLLPQRMAGQTSELLQITAIQVTPGNPVQFTFNDAGTGATNYLVEFSPAVGTSAVWSNITTAVIVPAGAGNFHVQVPETESAVGFYRVRGYGGAAGFVTASFNSTAFQVTEGGMISPTINFSAPYHGIVRYTISGTVASGDYTSLSGEVFVNGTTATIPVALRDNEAIGQWQFLTLILEGGPGLQLGAGSQTTIGILENDADWQGSFITDDVTLGFVLRIQESNGMRMATLTSDGFGFFPQTETAASLSFTEDFFAAAAGGVTVSPSATLLNLPMTLTLALRAQNGLANQSVSPTFVQGVGTLISAISGKPHFNTTNNGTFLLLKPAVLPSTNQVELVTAP